MMKMWGLVLLATADVLLVHYLVERKKKTIRCLREMIGFSGGVTYGITEWKRTLEKAMMQEKHQGMFPKLFQEKLISYRTELSLREAINKALEELPLPYEAAELFSCYFANLGKSTKKYTEEQFRHTKKRLEEMLQSLREDLPKTKKIISAGVYSISGMIAILLL
ncbi:MAG: hypothetical protein E7413_05405 [Ruminococcaceae bacterium]|nr:hypothetical protein [Oscillospiraceae bacterium]